MFKLLLRMLKFSYGNLSFSSHSLASLLAMQGLLARGRVHHDVSLPDAHTSFDDPWILCWKSINYLVFTISDVKGLAEGSELGSPEGNCREIYHGCLSPSLTFLPHQS